MSSTCKDCGSKEDYNFSLNIKLCNACIGVRLEQLQAELDKHRWLPTDEPPDNIDWDIKVEALEYESKIPIIMTMAGIFLDEDSEIEYYRPIILPEDKP